MLDMTDIAELIEDGETTVQYTVVDGVARLLIAGRDEQARGYVHQLFELVRVSIEAGRLDTPTRFTVRDGVGYVDFEVSPEGNARDFALSIGASGEEG